MNVPEGVQGKELWRILACPEPLQFHIGKAEESVRVTLVIQKWCLTSKDREPPMENVKRKGCSQKSIRRSHFSESLRENNTKEPRVSMKDVVRTVETLGDRLGRYVYVKVYEKEKNECATRVEKGG